MLDLRSMSDEEFCITVAETAPQAIMQVTIDENGKVLLNSKLAGKFVKKPIKFGFNKDCTVISDFLRF